MLHSALVKACRSYQSLFPAGHEGEGKLVELHETGRMDAFHQEYFRHELEKGLACLATFERFSERWPQWKVLDFGCGGGGLTCQLGTRFREAWGVDIDAAKLEFAERERDRLGHGNVHFECYNGRRLPFEDASFDCLFCVDVVEHLPTPEFFIGEFERVLRPGGQLLLSFGPPWRHPHGKHMWSKLPGWWTHLLFPRSVVMEVRGYDPKTKWEDIGLHRMTVARFESSMARSQFRPVHLDYRLKNALRPLRRIPWVREFFIAEVVAVFEKSKSL
jgi:ubiquinone/menaquinone biosynthesis C-methylase UbiE